MQKKTKFLNVKPRCCPERMDPRPPVLSYSEFSSAHSSAGITKLLFSGPHLALRIKKKEICKILETSSTVISYSPSRLAYRQRSTPILRRYSVRILTALQTSDNRTFIVCPGPGRQDARTPLPSFQ